MNATTSGGSVEAEKDAREELERLVRRLGLATVLVLLNRAAQKVATEN